MTRALRRLVALTGPYRWGLALAALLGFATIASSVGLMATSAYLISKATLAPSIAELNVAIIGVRVFGISRGLFRYLERIVSHRTTFHILARLRTSTYRAVEPLAPGIFLRQRSGDLLTRLVADVETLDNFYARVVTPPLVAALVALLGFVLLGVFDVWLGVALVVFLALAGVVAPLLTQRLSRSPARDAIALRAELNAVLVDGVQGLPDLLAWGQEERYTAQVHRLSEELAAAQQRLARWRGLGDALSGLLATLSASVILALAIPLVTAGRLDPVFLALLALAAIACFEAVTPLALALQNLETSVAAAERVFALVDAPPVVREPDVPSPMPRDSGIQVAGLTFAYNGDTPALADVSFSVAPGRRVALVGPTGAGKSTVVDLLARFLDYDTGSIRVGGHELRDYHGDDARALIGVVSQQTHLFNASVDENLRLARSKATAAEVVAAARVAQVHDVIAALPDGYQTLIGENGLRLSGGQRQRLAVARALLKDAPILILDEATAQLDPRTEQDLLHALSDLAQGRTTLVITHRLTGLDGVDEILVLDQGRIVERGTLAELLQAGGLFCRLWESVKRET